MITRWKKVFLVFFTCLLFVLCFDVSYLFRGIWCTYLRGESSAQIDDHKFFYTRTVSGGQPYEIPLGYNFVSTIENKKLKKILKSSESVAFLVVQNDSVRLEKYWGEGGLNTKTNSFSIAKSIMSLLIGSAIEAGFINNVEQSVFDFLPELKHGALNDVKIKHLLNMSSGYDWLENYKRPISVTAKAYYGVGLRELVLSRSFDELAGVHHNYNSGNTQLLGLVLERATGETVSSFAGRFLWSKIGARKNATWTLDDFGGVEKTFCCFNSNARDFSKIGLLMLNKGRTDFIKGANSDFVVSVDYVDWLLSAPVLVNKKTGKEVDYYSNGWWKANVLNRPVFYARGFLGQYIVVVPSLNLVFVRLGKKENEKSTLKNKYMLSDNLKFFIEEVIKDFSL